MSAHLEDMAVTCKDRLLRLASMEQSQIHTVIDPDFIDAKAIFLAELKRSNLPIFTPVSWHYKLGVCYFRSVRSKICIPVCILLVHGMIT